MKIATCSLESISPYSQSIRLPEKPPKMTWDDFEKQNWRLRIHRNAEGQAVIPPMAFKRALDTAASMLRMKVVGKKGSEYKKYFLSGVIVPEPLVLPIKVDDVAHEVLDLAPDGKRGGRGVFRWMPLFPSWSGVVQYFVVNDEIPKEVFEKH